MSNQTEARGSATVARYRSCLLISSDDHPTARFVRAMHQAGFAVLERARGPRSITSALSGDFDFIARVCSGETAADAEAIREIARGNRPVVALFDDATPDQISDFLDAGADACLRLDADERVVTAQVLAVLRRHEPVAGPDLGLLMVGDLTVDVHRCEVLRDGAYVPLTPSEFRIIEFLAKNAGRVFQPHQILNAVSTDYEYHPRDAAEVFKVYARRIRKKLEPSLSEPCYLVTARGFGYRLDGGRRREVLGAVSAAG